jgi:hypothetical protein
MEPLIAVGSLLILAVAAPRWGFDSRAALYSEEKRLASLGLVWVAGHRDTPEENDRA